MTTERGNERHVQPECDRCLYRDRPIVIASPRRFSGEILASYISNNTPARWEIVEQLPNVSTPDPIDKENWRLIFLDCISLSNENIFELLDKQGRPYLEHDIVALFNLSDQDIDFAGLIDRGVRGLFFENDQAEAILKGICALKNGELWVTRGILMEYVCQRPRKSVEDSSPIPDLTRREKDILRLLASGATNEQIAEQLFISPHTVKSHLQNALRKLGVKNRLQAALWAASHL